MMALLRHEWRLLVRSRLSVASLALLLLLSGFAVASGLVEIAQQRETITRLARLNQTDVDAVAKRLSSAGDAGDAAYYTYHATWDAPSPLAFAALGQRDIAPYAMRVNALGLEGQLYQGENFNPELALPGRFDFAFVLIYLVPLFVIALMHDLVSGEHEASRLPMLRALPGSARSLWLRRTSLRLALVLGAVLVPLLVGGALSGAPAGGLLAMVGIAALYVLFWFALVLLVNARAWTSITNATALMGLWISLTLILPALANMVMLRTIPVEQGVDIMLVQRQNVHAAWEVPREETMRRFYASHPEWNASPPLSPDFEWKWYFAFHQLGDESVARRVKDYHAGLEQRQSWTARTGVILPAVGAQHLLHRIAQTDLEAQLDHLDRIRAFHGNLRRFYYRYLFEGRPFRAEDFGRAPIWATDSTSLSKNP
jgi:ABC-2 type transport system permease protein